MYLDAPRSKALDVGLVVDSSSDIPAQDWKRIILFLRGVVRGINKVSSDPNSNRFGLISYASQPTVVFRFNTLQGNKLNTEAVAGLLDNLPRGSGVRRIDLALQRAARDLFSAKGGQRQQSRKVWLLVYYFKVQIEEYQYFFVRKFE